MPVTLEKAKTLNALSRAMREVLDDKKRKEMLHDICSTIDYLIVNYLHDLPRKSILLYHQRQCDSVIDEIRDMYPDFNIDISVHGLDERVCRISVDIKEECKHILYLPVEPFFQNKEEATEKPKPWYKKALSYFQHFINFQYLKL